MKFKMRYFPCLVLTALIIGCGGNKPVELKRTVGDYKLTIKAVPDGVGAGKCRRLMANAADTFKKRLNDISGEASIIDKINLKRDSIEVSPEIYRLMARVVELRAATDNRWNPFPGEALKSQGIGENAGSQSSADTLEQVYPQAAQTNLKLLGGNFVGLEGSGSLKLGRAALGWALDEAAKVMLDGGVKAGFLGADGVYRYWGRSVDQVKWHVDVNALPADSAAFVIETDSGGLCEIRFENLGEQHAGMINLTVWAPDAMRACLLAETMSAMDRTRLLAWSEATPDIGVFLIRREAVGVIGETNSRMSDWVSKL
jgi:thiamine biosynthesis lipoprotein ApbE